MVPDRVLPLFRACADAGGRALAVGGSVRDALLGRRVEDVDVEVHRIEVEPLVALLGRFGRVNEVGRSFGVLKVRIGPHDLDVSLPRRDSKQGPGHRGIRADADPYMGELEAARRRDLTINAIAYDPLDGSFVDPFAGRADLAARRLRAVDPQTFPEDPLRALRVAQFAGRFGFDADEELAELCRRVALDELPAERVRGEVEKLLSKAARPSVGWAFARRADLWSRVLPSWDHDALPALDAAAARPVRPAPRRLAMLFAAASADVDALTDVLDRLRVHRIGGYDVRAAASFLRDHVDDARGRPSASAVRRLAERGDVELLGHLAGNDDLLATAAALGVLSGPLPALVSGRDLRALGVEPGPTMGALLAEVRELQLDGALSTSEDATDWLRGRVSSEPP